MFINSKEESILSYIKLYVFESLILTYSFHAGQTNTLQWPGARETTHYWPNCVLGPPVEFLAVRVFIKLFPRGLFVDKMSNTLHFGLVPDKNQHDETCGQFSV